MTPWCSAVWKLLMFCLHNNAIVVRGIRVTQLHCGTPKLCLSAIYIVSSVGTSCIDIRSRNSSNILLSVIFITVCFRYIDQGKNPHLYTKDCMEKALEKNEAVKGKIDAFKVRKRQCALDLILKL